LRYAVCILIPVGIDALTGDWYEMEKDEISVRLVPDSIATR